MNIPAAAPARILGTALVLLVLLTSLMPSASGQAPAPTTSGLRVGAAAAEFEADDSMVIAGGIGPGKATGQEGKLRAVAVVLEKAGTTLAVVACDVLMLTRRSLDPVVAEINRATGIPSEHVLINCTHAHHAPSTMRVHDYDLDTVFTRRVQAGIVHAVRQATTNLAEARFQWRSSPTIGLGICRMTRDDE